MGFFSSFTKALFPGSLRYVFEAAPQTEPSSIELAKKCFHLYGHNTEYPFSDPKTGKPIFPDDLGYVGWLPPEEAAVWANEAIKLLHENGE